jgi:hypothetical protein
MQPMSLTMRLGWTNANLVGSITSGAISGFASGGIGGALAGGGTGALSSFTETRVKEVYKTMLDLQKKFEPMTIVTGKRTYENMLLIDISTKTDHTTEYSMIMECHFQEVIRVNTRTTTQPTISNQEMPDKTGQTTGAGTRQTGPGRTILRDMSGRPGYIKGQGLQASGGVGA